MTRIMIVLTVMTTNDRNGNDKRDVRQQQLGTCGPVLPIQKGLR